MSKVSSVKRTSVGIDSITLNVTVLARLSLDGGLLHQVVLGGGTPERK